MIGRVRIMVGWEPPAPELLVDLEDEVELVSATDPDAVRDLIGDVDAAYLTRLDADLLHRGQRLRWIQAAVGGVDRFLIPELTGSSVVLTSLKPCFDVAGAEHALGVALMWNRRLHVDLRTGPNSPWDFELPRELSGQTMGIVGFGNIGAALARRAAALGMRVLATARSPRPTPPHVDGWFGPGELLDLVGHSDFVVVTTPLTPETHGLVDATFMEAMGEAAVLIDVTGRPEVYDLDALRLALESGAVGGAAIQLPRPPPDSPLWSVKNLIICLHRIVTKEEERRTTAFFADNVRRFVAGEALAGLVDTRVGY